MIATCRIRELDRTFSQNPESEKRIEVTGDPEHPSFKLSTGQKSTP